MKRKALSVFAMIMVLSLAISSFTGCSTTAASTPPATPAPSTQAAATATVEPTPTAIEPIKLTQLVAPDSQLDPITGGDPNNTPFAKLRAKMTGVTIEPIPVGSGPDDYKQKVQLLIASKDTPDIMNEIADIYAGGAQKAFEDGVIIKLNDYLDKDTPNFKKVLTSDPEYEKFAKSDDGSLYSFGFFREQSIRVFFGPIVRDDLMKKANVAKVPETIDEWLAMLRAFKASGVKKPFSCVSWYPAYANEFAGAYGAGFGKMLSADGSLIYGPIQPGFKDFLAMWSGAVKEGLIDPDYMNQADQGEVKALVSGGDVGSFLGMLSWLKLKAADTAKDPDFHLTAAKHPVLTAGETPAYGRADNAFMPTSYISASCKNIDRALQYIDWGYSDDGIMVNNFGILGESYTMVNDYPTYSDLIMKDPNDKGWTQAVSLALYCPASGITDSVQDKRYFEQVRLTTPEQKAGQPLWAIFKTNITDLPLTMTQSELDVDTKMTEIQTYVDEMTQKFILGSEPLANFDAFVENVKKMGIEDVMKVENQALQRFNAR